MKKGIHPNYVDCTVTCSCGNTFKTRATKPEIRVEICSACHPFYTGQQKFVDTGGRVQRFSDKFGSANALVAAREAERKAKRAAQVAAAEEKRKAAKEAKAAEKAKRAEEFARKAAAEAERVAAVAAEEAAAVDEQATAAAEEAVDNMVAEAEAAAE